MPASYNNGKPSNSRRHPTCWASSQWSHTVSSARCHRTWTTAPLSAHRSIECKLTAPQIETPIWTRCTTSHLFIWQRQETCGAVGGSTMECGMYGQPHKTPHFHPRHRHPPHGCDPSKMTLGPAQPPTHRCRKFPLLLVQITYVLLCGLWVWRRRTNRRPCCPPMSNPSTSPWTAWPDGSVRWDNRIAA